MTEKRNPWAAGTVAVLALPPLLGAASSATAAEADQEIGPAVGSPAPGFTLAAVTDGAAPRSTGSPRTTPAT